MFGTKAVRLLALVGVLAGAVEGSWWGSFCGGCARRNANNKNFLGHEKIDCSTTTIGITVNFLDGSTKRERFAAGQTVRDLRARLASGGARFKLIGNSDGAARVLPDDESLEGLTADGVTAVRDLQPPTEVEQHEFEATVREHSLDIFKVRGLDDDIFLEKAPAGVSPALQASLYGGDGADNKVLYYMRSTELANPVTLAEVGWTPTTNFGRIAKLAELGWIRKNTGIIYIKPCRAGLDVELFFHMRQGRDRILPYGIIFTD